VQLHPNAKTTPLGRQRLVERVRRLGWSMQDAAQAAGISLRTGYRWLAREHPAVMSHAGRPALWSALRSGVASARPS